MKRKLLCLFVFLALLVGTASAAGQTQTHYAIRVNRAMNTVTIYTLDETGAYTIPVKAMVCSTARSGYTTPLGEFRLEAYRSEWRLMFDGTYGQYATRFAWSISAITAPSDIIRFGWRPSIYAAWRFTSI